MKTGKEFVGHYPNLFTEDKEWWAQKLDEHFNNKITFKCPYCKSVEVEEAHHACERCCVRGENTGHNFKLD